MVNVSSGPLFQVIHGLNFLPFFSFAHGTDQSPGGRHPSLHRLLLHAERQEKWSPPSLRQGPPKARGVPLPLQVSFYFRVTRFSDYITRFSGICMEFRNQSIFFADIWSTVWRSRRTSNTRSTCCSSLKNPSIATWTKGLSPAGGSIWDLVRNWIYS